ncbi:conserved hypothetical protein [Thiomonas sp. X19]|uniref:hypothetical protein n=1 Tax=Thiomonas sp. X19 TaxID=1050370 RepID=UPI000B747C85|nr:hypothetical protein [Thiomonas sp. X19]SCC92784.1 conserved hypothetical protein [Thiomonas sp. X19]
MARQPRLCVPGLPHLVQLVAAPGMRPLALEEQRARFLGWMAGSLEAFPTQLHAYSLLHDGVWMLLTPHAPKGLSGFVQTLARRASRVLGEEQAKQTLPDMPVPERRPMWAGRFRSAVLEPAAWALPAMVWVDDAARRAELVATGQVWPWSSQSAHCGLGAGGSKAPALQLPSAYWALGNTPFEREAAYTQLLLAGLHAQRVRELEQALRSGSALGEANFLEQLTQRSGRRLRPALRGRPRKQGETPGSAG